MPLIDLTLSPFTGITNKIVVLAKETTNLSNVVTYQEFNPPHNNPRNVSLTVANPVPHNVEVYESTGYPVLGTLLGSFTNDAGKVGLTTIYPPVYLIVGGTDPNDPAANVKNFSHPDLVGRVEIIFFRRTVELVQPSEYTFTPGTGNIALLDPADQFISGERLTVLIQPEASTVTATVTTLDLFTDLETVTADITVTQLLHNKKLLHCISNTTTLTLTLDPIATFANKALIGFKTSYGDPGLPGTGNQKQMSIVFDNASDYIDNEAAIFLGQKEFITLIKLNNKWHVINEHWGIDRVGEPVYGDVQMLNTLAEDGLERNRADFPRIWNYIDSLPPSQVVTDVAWLATATNKGLFSSGDGVGTFRMPLGYNKFRRSIYDETGTDTSRVPSLPGGYQADMVGPHNHPLPPVHNENGGGLHLASGNNGPAEGPCADATSNNTGTETRPINLGYLPLRRI